MENTTHSPFKMTQLTAINVAKATTIILLIGFALVLGIQDWRQVIYLCFHISYCLWWLIEQWFYPQRSKAIFTESTGVVGLILAVIIVGCLYTLPGYLAFINPIPISFITVAIAIPLFYFGSLINAAADVQKLTAKQYGEGLVKDNIWRFSRNINYFGDLLRYLSFAIVAGSPWAYIVPGFILILYLQRIFAKEKTMSEKYPNYQEYQNNSTRLIPFIW